MSAYANIPEKRLRFSFWKIIFGVILAFGLTATYVRFFKGLGAATNLSDQFPWGLWIGFDVLCGVGLAAGGFTMAAMVYIFNIRQFKPVIRPAILTAFLGYLLVIVALLFDLGQPFRIWHPLVMWNPRSVMFEISWCVTLYTTVLALEFSPIVFERLRMERPLKIIRHITVPLVILGVIFSMLHQSSLGALFLIVPEKLHPLWYSSLLPVHFFVSSVAVGFAMVIFESYLSARAFNKQLEQPLLMNLARVVVLVLAVGLVLKIQDWSGNGARDYLFLHATETYFFWGEVLLGMALPMILLAIPAVRRHPRWLFISTLLVVLGFVMNRLNVSITAMESYSGANYFPSWMEISVTLMIVAIGFAAFRWVVKNFPIFQVVESLPLSPQGPIRVTVRKQAR